MTEPASARLGDRSLFPDLAWRAYCNHASISPPSQPVRDAIDRHVALWAERGLAGYHDWLHDQEQLRADLAALIGAEPADLGFVPNTTAGVLDVALCMPWRAGDRIVVFDGEFPTNVTPWQQAAKTWDLEITMLPLDGFGDHSGRGLQRLEDTLRDGTRLVAVSAVEFQTGLLMPLKEMADLCHAHGAELFVDAIQALGAVPLDVRNLGIDYLAAGSHKWLMGVMGAGLLYVAPERIGALEPRVAGWLSHEDPLIYLTQGPGELRYDRPIRRRADFVEGGVGGTTALAALAASTGLIRSLGLEAVHRHLQGYLDRLERSLLRRGFASLRAPDPTARSSILAVRPPPGLTHADVAAGLNARGIAVSNPDGNLRFSPHWPNGHPEIQTIADALDDVLAELRS